MRPVLIESLNNHFNTDIFSWLIPSSSLIYVIVFIAVLIVFVNRATNFGLSCSHAFWSGIWAIAFGLVGARIYYLLQHLDSVIQFPKQIFDLSGSTGSWGGYIGGTFGFFLSLRLYGLYGAQIIKFLDAAVSALGLGIFIGRLGCFLDGCCFGTISSVPWAVRFPVGSLPYKAQLREGLIASSAQTSLPIHPVQLYLAINGLLLFILASWYWHRLRHRPGATFCLYWLGWCITRFLWEFLRGDKIRGEIGLVSTPQFICLLTMAPLILGLWYFLKSKIINTNIGEE